MLNYVHDGFLALSAVSFGTAIHHGLAWLRRRDLKANLYFSGVALVMALYAFSLRMKIDSVELDEWMWHSRFEFALVFILIPLFVETIAQATRSGRFRNRAILLLPLLGLFVWHLLSPLGFSFSSVRGLVLVEEPWGERIMWVDATTNILYQALLVYVIGWCLWFLRCAWGWSRKGPSLSSWGLMASFVLLLGCVCVEAYMQIKMGSFRFPLVEVAMLVIVGATSLLLSDEVMRISLLQDELKKAREELLSANAELERRVDARTRELREALSELDDLSETFERDVASQMARIARPPKDATRGRGDSHVSEAGYLMDSRDAQRTMWDILDEFAGNLHVRCGVPQPVEFDLSATIREVAGDMCERHLDQDVKVEIQESLIAFTDPDLAKVAIRIAMGRFWKMVQDAGPTKVEIFRDEVWVVVRKGNLQSDPRASSGFSRRSESDHVEAMVVEDGASMLVRRILRRLGGELILERTEDYGEEQRLRIPGLAIVRS